MREMVAVYAITMMLMLIMVWLAEWVDWLFRAGHCCEGAGEFRKLVITWITSLLLVGYFNYWDLIGKHPLTSQVHVWPNPFWQQQDSTPPPHPCSYNLARFRDHMPLLCPTTSNVQSGFQPSHQITGNSLSKGDKCVPHCYLVACSQNHWKFTIQRRYTCTALVPCHFGGVPWCLFWFNRSGTPPTTPHTNNSFI